MTDSHGLPWIHWYLFKSFKSLTGNRAKNALRVNPQSIGFHHGHAEVTKWVGGRLTRRANAELFALSTIALPTLEKRVKNIMSRRRQTEKEEYWLNHYCWCDREMGEESERFSINTKFRDPKDYRKNAGKIVEFTCRAWTAR